jgi:hypothetical protein
LRNARNFYFSFIGKYSDQRKPPNIFYLNATWLAFR